MSELAGLLCHAFQREKLAARQLSRRQGCSPEEALRSVLKVSANGQSLDALFVQRQALRELHVSRRLARQQSSLEKFQLARQTQVCDPLAWQAWFDGSATPNPGQLGLGVLLLDPAGRAMNLSQTAGYGDSTLAEYLALILLLEQAITTQITRLVVYGDSQVVIYDVLGRMLIDRSDCKEHRCHARNLMARFADISLSWVPRAKNKRADTLSRNAFVQNFPNNV